MTTNNLIIEKRIWSTSVTASYTDKLIESLFNEIYISIIGRKVITKFIYWTFKLYELFLNFENLIKWNFLRPYYFFGTWRPRVIDKFFKSIFSGKIF